MCDAYIERGGEGVYLHDVLLLVLHDVVHGVLRRLVRVSKLLLGLHHPCALAAKKTFEKKSLKNTFIPHLLPVSLLAVVIQFVARHLTPQVRHLRQVLLLKHDGGLR